MEYSPINFTGDYAQQVHEAVLEANRTSERGLLRTEDNVKNERILTSVSGGVKWQSYKEKIRETDLDGLAAVNDLKFGDRKVLPKKIMAFDVWAYDKLRFTRFAKDMPAGAKNIGSSEFEKAATNYLIPRMGKSYEALMYQSITPETKAAIAASTTIPASQKAWAAGQPDGMFDGLIARMITGSEAQAGGGVVKSVVAVNGGVTALNVLDEYAKIYNALDDAELEEGNCRIFAPLADFKIVQNANLNQQFRDKFVVSGSGKDTVVTFLNVPVEYVPTGGPRFGGKSGEDGDFVHATDLASDATQFIVNNVNNYSDDKFFKMVATSDTTVLNNGKKVLYL